MLGVLAVLAIGCHSSAGGVDGSGDAASSHDAASCDGAVTTTVLMLVAESPLDGVAQVVVRVVDSAGGMRTFVQPFNPPVAITPFDGQALTVPLPDVPAGALAVSVEARDAVACTLARGMTPFTISPCAQVHVSVILSPVAGCGGLDGGSDR
jgi:hypothetical protein